jgi:hypothetical protein
MRSALRRALRSPAREPGETWRDAVIKGLLKAAGDGNVGAAALIFDRVDGKAKDEQNVEHAGKIEIEVTYSRRRPDPAGTAGAAPEPAADQG